MYLDRDCETPDETTLGRSIPRLPIPSCTKVRRAKGIEKRKLPPDSPETLESQTVRIQFSPDLPGNKKEFALSIHPFRIHHKTWTE